LRRLRKSGGLKSILPESTLKIKLRKVEKIKIQNQIIYKTASEGKMM